MVGQCENRHLATDNQNGIAKLFKTKTEKLQDEHNLEKLRIYHQHEMEIGTAICEAKKQDIKIQIAAALAQKRVILDTQTKDKVSEIYQNFSQTMSDRLKPAVQIYLDGLKQAEVIPSDRAREKLIDYSQRKFEQDCNLIEDLANDVLQNIYTSLDIER